MIKPKKFVGLHAHTTVGSPFDGLGKPEEHFDYVLENGGSALAITEHGNMNSYGGAYLYSEQLKKEGKNFKFLPGVESYWHPSLSQWSLEMKAAEQEKKERKKAGKELKEEVGTTTVEDEDATKSGKKFNPLKRRYHLLVLPKTPEGLRSLFELVSFSYTEGRYFYPRIDTEHLKKIGKDLIVSTACVGGIFARTIFNHQKEENSDLWVPNDYNHDIIMTELENLVDVFVDAVGEENFFLELLFNKMNKQHLLNQYLIELSEKTGIKLIATADSHYPRPELWQAREMYQRLGWLGKKDNEPLPKSIDDLEYELYPKNADQMWESYKSTTKKYDFYDDQVVCDAIERTHDIAFDLIQDPAPDCKVKLPSYTVPKGEIPIKALIRFAKEGMIAKGLHKKKKYIERLKEEIRVIRDKDFAEYFLAKKSIMDIARKHMLVGPARGSAASSLVCYCLGITTVDPIKYELLFSRFLSTNRKTLPDIDSDFSDRDKLLSILRKEYGTNNVIAISNLNTFQLKSLVKDISRYYEIPFDETNAATKWLDKDVIGGLMEEEGVDRHNVKITFENAMKYSSDFREYIEAHPEVETFVVQLNAQTKSIGRHAGGVVISDDILSQMPVIVSKGIMQTPWVEAQLVKQLEPFGWVKFDLLGLDTLKIIERCIFLILQRHEGIEEPTFEDVYRWYSENLDPEVNEYDDQKVYSVFQKKLAGIFQVTQKRTQKFFKEAQPISIIDIAALTAIYRPGPLAADVDKLYVGAKNNPESREKKHPLIEQVLNETEGFLVFQESAMALGHVVGGLPLDECDTLRKVVSKKPTKEDPLYKKGLELKSRFIQGAVENGVEKSEAEELYANMMEFAAYSFNKCLEENTTVTIRREGRIYDNVKIKDVVIGDFVDSKNGFVKVLDKIDTGIKPVFVCVLQNNMSICCTLEHKIETNMGMMTLQQILQAWGQGADNIWFSVKPSPQFSPHSQSMFFWSAGESQTYDLEVDHPDHTFYADGINVSNSHAVSYGINSYMCAWLLTYYEAEWLCAYMESQSKKPDDKAAALLELKSFGYEVVHLDINQATENWIILPDKKFMPSLAACKGVGLVAIEEIKRLRPYKNIYDFLWDEEGKWKHSKANKKVVANLIKIGAFESLDCVGEDKTFVNYRQMHDVLIENWTVLKKCLKKDNLLTQMEKLSDLIESGPMVPIQSCQSAVTIIEEVSKKRKVEKVPRGPYSEKDWNTKEKVTNYLDLMGEIDLSLLVPKWLIEEMTRRQNPPIDQFPENRSKKAVWFVVLEKDVRKTKSGKKYLSITTIGVTGKKIRVYIWDWDGEEIQLFRPFGAILSKSDWGYSCHIRDVRILKARK